MSEDDEDEVNIFVFSKQRSLDSPLSFLSKFLLFLCLELHVLYIHVVYVYTHLCICMHVCVYI